MKIFAPNDQYLFVLKIYVETFKLIDKSWILWCTIIKPTFFSKLMKLFWSWHSNKSSWDNEFELCVTLRKFPSIDMYLIKKLFTKETTFITNGRSFRAELFPIWLGTENVVWTDYCKKKFLQVHVAVGTMEYFDTKGTKEFQLVATLVMDISSCILYVATPKYLDCM